MNIKIENLYSLDQTIAKDLLSQVEYGWEALTKISDFIIKLGNSLDLEKFNKIGENIWIAKSATVAQTASITGPTIIDENAEIRYGAYIRGKVIVGKNAVVGNSVELKNCILFNDTQIPHYNYVGDSIIGYKAHMGAGSITSNIKADKSNVIIKYNGEEIINTGLKKCGAMLGDYAEVGCNSVLNPGTIIGKNSNIYPLSCVRGIVPENVIYKNPTEIIDKIKRD